MRVFCCFLFMFTFSCNAADLNNKFAVKGAGRKPCSDFIQAMDSRTSDYYMYGGWLEGYISAYNQSQGNNYDITPWQTTELLLSLIKYQCKNNQNMPFLNATNSLMKTMFPIRLKQEDKIVEINANDRKSYYYSRTLTDAKQRLKKLGFISYEIDDKFSERDVKAFADFQKKAGLKITGVPDQITLTNLFLKPKKQ